MEDDSFPAEPALPSRPLSSTSPVAEEEEESQPIDLDPSAPYPPNCLVFVRNVHPETNKTTLRALFSAALSEGGEDLPPDGIDYVDFTKGLDAVRSIICFA